MNSTIKTIIFDVPIVGTEPGKVLYTVPIEIPVEIDDSGNEVMTDVGTALVQQAQARYMGLLTPEEIRELRVVRLCKTQSEMAELLGCGEKSYTRWENGHSRPSQMVNRLLRLLWEGRIRLEDLKAVSASRNVDNFEVLSVFTFETTGKAVSEKTDEEIWEIADFEDSKIITLPTALPSSSSRICKPDFSSNPEPMYG